MAKTIILHIPTGRAFESDSRVTRCPFGKNRKMKPTDSIYNEVCDGCQDNWGGRQNSQETVNRCYYEKQKRLVMAQYIDKDALVAEIEKRAGFNKALNAYSRADECNAILSFIDTLEVKEVDLDALGVLAEHLIACDAHLITPKYTDKELNMLEEWAKNNKAQKGEKV